MAIEIRKGIEGKVCSGCGEWKPLNEFYNETAKGASQGQKQNICKECAKKRGK